MTLVNGKNFLFFLKRDYKAENQEGKICCFYLVQSEIKRHSYHLASTDCRIINSVFRVTLCCLILL